LYFRRSHPLVKIARGSLVDLPTPASISFLWNYGSLLGMVLISQLVTGVFLSIHYTADVSIRFDSVIHILRDVNNGWFMRVLHINGASLFLIFIYLHIARGLYYRVFSSNPVVWLRGVIIFLILIATAFMGYVLPWGQMRFWGATVITNLLSAIPYLGGMLVEWLWGGFSVGNATLTRFFSLHFLLPFILLALVIVHLLFLHEGGRSSPGGVKPSWERVPFHPLFSSKDLLGFLVSFLLFLLLVVDSPYLLGDPDNFTAANPLSTPEHIQPEWYFLFAYAILRSIPNKLGGVVALVLSIVSLVFLSLGRRVYLSTRFSPSTKVFFWAFSSSFLILTWIGANPVEPPFEAIGQVFSFLYFFSLFGML